MDGKRTTEPMRGDFNEREEFMIDGDSSSSFSSSEKVIPEE